MMDVSGLNKFVASRYSDHDTGKCFRCGSKVCRWCGGTGEERIFDGPCNADWHTSKCRGCNGVIHALDSCIKKMISAAINSQKTKEGK